MEEKKKKLTEKQEKFLEALIGEAGGDYKKALLLAGYSDNTKVSEVIGGLRDEIIRVTMDSIIMDGPKAAAKLRGILDNPTSGGAINVIKVANSLLDRIGVLNGQQGALNLKVPKGGLVILPAKGGKVEAVEEVEVEEEDEDASEE